MMEMAKQFIGVIIISLTWFSVGYSWNKHKLLKEYLRGVDDGFQHARNYIKAFFAGENAILDELFGEIENQRKEQADE